MGQYTEEQQKEMMEAYLQEEYSKYVAKKKRLASAAEWAKYLNVSPTSLSQWMTGQRLPVGRNVFRLASKLPGVMEILGYPDIMPDDPIINRIVKVYHELDKEGQKELEAYIDSLGEFEGNKAHAQA